MAKLELSDAAKALIANEINRMREDYARSVGTTVEELGRICRSSDKAAGHLPAFVKEDAVDVVTKKVTVYLNRSVDEGFGICFKAWNFIGREVAIPCFIPVIIDALQAALVASGVITVKGRRGNEEFIAFVHFVEDYHRVVFEHGVTEAFLFREICDVEGGIAAMDSEIASLKRMASEEMEKAESAVKVLNEKKAKVDEERIAQQAKLFGLTRVLGKRTGADGGSEAKRAKGPDGAHGGDA